MQPTTSIGLAAILLCSVALTAGQGRGSSRYQRGNTDETSLETHRFGTNHERVNAENSDFSSSRTGGRQRSRTQSASPRQSARVYNSRNEVIPSSTPSPSLSRQFPSRGGQSSSSSRNAPTSSKSGSETGPEVTDFSRTRDRIQSRAEVTETPARGKDRSQSRGEITSHRRGGVTPDTRSRSRDPTRNIALETETENSIRNQGQSRTSGRSRSRSGFDQQPSQVERGQSRNIKTGRTSEVTTESDNSHRRGRNQGRSRENNYSRKIDYDRSHPKEHLNSRNDVTDSRRTVASEGNADVNPHTSDRGAVRGHGATKQSHENAEGTETFQRNGYRNTHRNNNAMKSKNGLKEEKTETTPPTVESPVTANGLSEAVPEISPPSASTLLLSTESDQGAIEISPQVLEPLHSTVAAIPPVPEVAEELPKKLQDEETESLLSPVKDQVDKISSRSDNVESLVSSTENLQQAFSKGADRSTKLRGGNRDTVRSGVEYDKKETSAKPTISRTSDTRTGRRRSFEENNKGFRSRGKSEDLRVQESSTQPVSFRSRGRNIKFESDPSLDTESKRKSINDDYSFRRTDSNRGSERNSRARPSENLRSRRPVTSPSIEASSLEITKHELDGSTENSYTASPLTTNSYLRGGRDPETSTALNTRSNLLSQRHRFQTAQSDPLNKYKVRPKPSKQEVSTEESVKTISTTERKIYDPRRNMRKSLKRLIASNNDEPARNIESQNNLENKPAGLFNTKREPEPSTEKEHIVTIGGKPIGGRSRGVVKSSKDVGTLVGKKPVSEEVHDDENYPEVYKQLKKAGRGPKEILVQHGN